MSLNRWESLTTVSLYMAMDCAKHPYLLHALETILYCLLGIIRNCLFSSGVYLFIVQLYVQTYPLLPGLGSALSLGNAPQSSNAIKSLKRRCNVIYAV